MKITEKILHLISWTTPLNIPYLKNRSKIDEKVYSLTRKIFNFLLHNQYAIAVSVWSYLLIEVGVATSTLMPLSSSPYNLEFCQNDFCDYWNASHQGYKEFTPLVEFRCNSSHSEYEPFSSYKECIDNLDAYASILQNSVHWLKSCQDRFCEYWNDTHEIFINSGATIKNPCNSSHPEQEPYSSYNECIYNLNTYLSTVEKLQNLIQVCETQFCDYVYEHNKTEIESKLNKKFELNIQSICNSSDSQYSSFSSLTKCMELFHEYVSMFEKPVESPEFSPLQRYWNVFCPKEYIMNWNPSKIARYMAKCFKKLCHDYHFYGIDLDKQLYDWCTYKDKMQNSKKLFRKILRKIKASQTDQWNIESIIGILVQSFQSNMENIYSILGSLITENSQLKTLPIPDMTLLKEKFSEITSSTSKMIKDLIHVAMIREEEFSENLIESLLKLLSDMENVFT